MELDKSGLLELYRIMVKIRVFEETILDICSREEVPGSSHLYIGQEAIAAGVCAALTAQDQICTTYRGHGHCIARGGDLGRMMAEFYGRAEGYCGGRGGSLHIASRSLGMLGANGIVGAGSPIAVGAAFAQKYQKTRDVTVVFFGDGASNRGTQHEAMNLASVWKLPVIFVVENNEVAFYTAQRDHQCIRDISVRAAGYGFCGVTADGNDVLAVYAAARQAVEQCRNGEGPVLLEYKTWRHLGHYVGDPCLYKDQADQTYWLTQKDPIRNFGAYLTDCGVVESAAVLNAVRNELRAQAEAAAAWARTLPFPDEAELCSGTYAEG